MILLVVNLFCRTSAFEGLKIGESIRGNLCQIESQYLLSFGRISSTSKNIRCNFFLSFFSDFQMENLIDEIMEKTSAMENLLFEIMEKMSTMEKTSAELCCSSIAILLLLLLVSIPNIHLIHQVSKI